MPRTKFLLGGVGIRQWIRRALDAGAQEALEVLRLCTRDIFFMHGCLILEEQLELCLGHRVTLDGDLEPMCRFNGEFSSRVNRPFDIAVLAFMHR